MNNLFLYSPYNVYGTSYIKFILETAQLRTV